MENLLSVVAPTRNRGDISECLLQLLGQSHHPLEILVIDQSDGTETAECVERLKETHPTEGVDLIHHPSKSLGLSNARNEGIERARGEWIAFVDDDVLVTRDWAARLIDEFRSSERVGMVFGQTRAFYPPEAEMRVRVSIKDLPTPQRFRSRFGLIARSVGGGGNSSISRRCLESIGKFHPKLGVGGVYPGAEDYDLTYRAIRAGFELCYAPKAIAHHKRKLAESDYLRTERGYYEGRAAAIAKQVRSGDLAAPIALVLELGRRWIEIPYHLIVTRHKANTKRAWVRTAGFIRGMSRGLFEDW